jgi:chemotaxis response regulator CheB
MQHRALEHPDVLVHLLGKHSGLPVRHARDGEPLQAGMVYVCPPGMQPTR